VIYVGFSTSSAWYSRVIRAATGAKCSHVFLITDVLGVRLVLEEGTFGYSTRTLDNMIASGSNVVQILTPLVPLDLAVKHSFDWLGQRYDYVGLLGMAWVMIMRAMRHRVSNPLASPHAAFCSEEVTNVLRFAKHPNVDQLDPPSTDPEDLRRALVNAGCLTNYDLLPISK
jgi:hypothetical protein